MKDFFSKIKNGIVKIISNIKKTFINLKNKIKDLFNRNKKNQGINNTDNEPIFYNENTNSLSKGNQTITKTNTIPLNSNIKYRTDGNEAIVTPIVMNKPKNNNIPTKKMNNVINQDNLSPSEEVNNLDNSINNENTERISSIVINESTGIVEFETITGKKYQKNIEDILSEKKNIYKDWNINKKCNDFAKNKIQALMLRRKINPVVVSTLNNEEDIDNYIKCINNKEKIWFNLEHDLINSKLKGKNARLMKRAGKQEEKIGAKVKRKEGLIEKMLKNFKTNNKEAEEIAEEVETLENDANELNNAITPQNIEKNENPLETNNTKKTNIIAKTKKAIDAITKEKSKEKQEKEDDGKKRESADFNKRYKDYNVLAKGILGEPAKKDIKDIESDLIHNDIYNMTSNDDATKGVATFRMGHRLAPIPEKKKEAERLLKAAISILNNDNVLSKDEALMGVLQNAHMDLGNFYLMNDDFANAEKSFQNYMKAVKKEKIEKYDPKILEAKKNGKVIDEIDLWIKIKSKFAAGKKSMIKLLSRSGRTEEAEELYKKLLEDCKISLSDEEYQLSVDTNCIENGRYMRIADDRTFCEPILGNEYLLQKRKKISNKVLSER